MNSLGEIGDVLRKSSRILLCGHVIPDGDCLGSVSAMAIVLEGMGKVVTIASPDSLPETLLFLPGADSYCTDPEIDQDYDTFIALDCSVPERLGSFRRFLDNQKIVVINIDHHLISNGFSSFAHYNYHDSNAAATGEILIDLFDVMEINLSKDLATCLYVALVTDTGSFRYENTSPGTLRKAARLMETGIPTAAINILLFEEKPARNIQVLAAALAKLQFSSCGKVAWTAVEGDLLRKFSASDEHTEGLNNIIRTIKGVEVAVIFKEIEKGRYKIGFRSKGDVDVNRIASMFGGGGHARASGCVLTGDLQQIIVKVLDAVTRDVSRA